jgi:hypothetical protein
MKGRCSELGFGVRGSGLEGLGLAMMSLVIQLVVRNLGGDLMGGGGGEKLEGITVASDCKCDFTWVSTGVLTGYMHVFRYL